MPVIVARSAAPRHAPGPDARSVPVRACGVAARSALSLLVAALLVLPVQADDIDVYTARLTERHKPNILFVLDYSGSMQQDVYGSGTTYPGFESKIDILRAAIDEVLRRNERTIRAGIGSLYASSPSGVRWPIGDLDADAHDVDPSIPVGTLTAAEAIRGQLDRLDASGTTPTVEALVEAAQYFRGARVTNGGRDRLNGAEHEPDVWNADEGRYGGGNPRAAIPASYTPRDAWRRGVENGGAPWSASYVSPIERSCQANAIVLISDGLPNAVVNEEPLRELIGMERDECEDLSSTIFDETSGKNGNCGPELVRQLADNPQVDGIADSTVRTHAIGFGVKGDGSDYLERLAREGKGRFFSATRPEELADALARIVDDVLGSSESFVELAVDVDKTSFSHDDRAYFSLFAPSRSRGWSGNLKGYFLGAEGFTDINGAPALLDSGNTEGLDGARFAPGAQSFWSTGADGNEVTAGGASARLAAAGRTLYTYTGAPGDIGEAGIDLAGGDNHRLIAANAAIGADDLGLPAGSPGRASAIDWLQGAPMGDPLHSKSVAVDYGTRQVVFVMTNQGLLHAIDASAPSAPAVGDATGGEEIFAWMPGSLLPNLPALESEAGRGPYADPSADGGADAAHIYGLDGAITRWHVDLDGDGVVDEGDSLWLILGMRRGGEAYHAIDVTNPTRPILRWSIDSATAGFERLAQSWSRAALVNVRRGDSSERVLMFGGGYDAAALDGSDAAVPSRGNAIYMVARDGTLLQSVQASDHADLRHAFAADLTVIDSDADGLADRLYAGDLGGQAWRVDFDDVDDEDDTTVTRLAALGTTRHHPFFGAPSVALNRTPDGDFFSVALGSGNRTDPLELGSRNALFMLRDTDVAKGAPALASGTSFDAIEVEELHDATDDPLGSSDADVALAARKDLAGARGWRLDLATGEKSLTRLVSFGGQLLATTFQALNRTNDDPCLPDIDSRARFYRMDLESARPPEGTEEEKSGRRSRHVPIDTHAIPPSPAVIFPKGSSTAQILVGRRRVDSIEQRLARVYWHAK